MTNWPPRYELRISHRARYARLNISAAKGLEVVIPKKFNQKLIPAFINEHRNWIVKQLAKYDYKATLELPEEIYLEAIDQKWAVEYVETSQQFVRVLALENNTLQMIGNVSNQKLCCEALRRWLRQQSKMHLLPWLELLSVKMALNYRKASVRYARTRWGSCSNQSDISLNIALLLLPAYLVEYVIVHELSHLVHFDHSKQFWQLVETVVQNYKKCRKDLHQHQIILPKWLEAT